MFIAACGSASSTAEDGTAGEAIEQKRFDSLCARAREAYEGDSGNVEIISTYAHNLASAVSARDLYKKIIARKSAPDSIRADAYYRLACIAYMAANYRKAAAHCAHALEFEDKARYTSLSLRTVMQPRGDSTVKTATPTTTAAAMLYRSGDTGTQSKKALDIAAARARPAAGHYYLQVGAFAAVENAQGLKNELSRRFSQVSVAAAVSGGKKVFRVRVGAFFNKESAQAFGDSALSKKGISYRIVEE